MPRSLYIAQLATVCLTAVVCCSTALAKDDNKKSSPAEYSAEFGVGAEYDSNVSVEEVDAATGEGDYALTMDLGLEAKKGFTEQFDGAVSYDFSQSLYDEFSQVDRQTHIFGADVAYSAAALDTGLSTYYIHSRLDGDKFLELYRLSPSLSGFLAKKWYARGAYVFSDKSIEQRPDRDANTNAGEFDLYFFRRGLRSYFNFGYRYRDEDAEADRYDYSSHSVKARYIHRWEVFSRLTKLELSWRYEDRDYDGVTPSIGEERDDERHRWRADLEVPLIAAAAVQFYYAYSDYESNFPQADYTQYLVGTRFVYRW